MRQQPLLKHAAQRRTAAASGYALSGAGRNLATCCHALRLAVGSLEPMKANSRVGPVLEDVEALLADAEALRRRTQQ
ncbi:hypothetical protein [Sedimentitalea sp.]|uniref:hypothetical protein n=1 Tax=Sedimentitalea sp. TaxID=2048915 RepID=UPI003299CDF7